MDTQRLSAYLLLAGVALMLAWWPLGLGGKVHGTQDFNQRLEIINANETRWVISQTLIAVSLLLTAVGRRRLLTWLTT